MTTSVTGGLPAERGPVDPVDGVDPVAVDRVDAADAADEPPEPSTATAQSASPLAGSERVQSVPDPDIPASAVGRIPILAVAPVVDGGRFTAKAVVGEPVPVAATVFREGHDAVAATAVLVDPDGVPHTRVRMTLLAPGTDRYGATVVPDREGTWTFHVEGWSDVYGTWEHAATIKVPAGIDVELMLEEGARVLEQAVGVPGVGEEDSAVLRGRRRAAARLGCGSAGPPGGGDRPGGARRAGPSPVARPAHGEPELPVARPARAGALQRVVRDVPAQRGGPRRPESGRWVSGTFATAAQRCRRSATSGSTSSTSRRSTPSAG